MCFLFSLTVPQQLFFLSSHWKVQERKGNFPHTICGHILLFPYQFCHFGMSCCQVLCHALSVISHVDFHVICWVAKFVNFGSRIVVFLGNILCQNRPSFEQLHQLPDFLRGCKILKMSCLGFVIHPKFSIVCCNFLPSCHLNSCCLWNPETEGYVIICFIPSYCSRMECKTGLFYLCSLSIGLVSNVAFVSLLQETEIFGHNYIRFRRRSLVKTLHASLMSVSLHHMQCDILCKIQHENTKWSRVINDVWCFTAILSSCAPVSWSTTLFWRQNSSVHCNYVVVVCGSGWLWTSSSSSSEVLAEFGLSGAWALEHAVYSLCNHVCGSRRTSS